MTNEQALAPIISLLADKIRNEDFVISPSLWKTVELVAPIIELDPTQPNLKFGNIRQTPEKYVRKELEWYLSESLSSEVIAKSAKIWKQISSRDDKVNSNYGWCIFSEENFNQFANAARELLTNPDSRRACMLYNRPSMWNDYNENGMSDFMCTFATQHMIRDHELLTVVNMRSNDIIFGFFNDFWWQSFVHNMLHENLNKKYPGIGPGKILWIANSLHAYERHFKMILEMDELLSQTTNQTENNGI